MTRNHRFQPQAFALAVVCTLATFLSIEHLATVPPADVALTQAPVTTSAVQQVVVIHAQRGARS